MFRNLITRATPNASKTATRIQAKIPIPITAVTLMRTSRVRLERRYRHLAEPRPAGRRHVHPRMVQLRSARPYVVGHLPVRATGNNMGCCALSTVPPVPETCAACPGNSAAGRSIETGRLGPFARRLILHLPQDWPSKFGFDELFHGARSWPTSELTRRDMSALWTGEVIAVHSVAYR